MVILKIGSDDKSLALSVSLIKKTNQVDQIVSVGGSYDGGELSSLLGTSTPIIIHDGPIDAGPATVMVSAGNYWTKTLFNGTIIVPEYGGSVVFIYKNGRTLKCTIPFGRWRDVATDGRYLVIVGAGARFVRIQISDMSVELSDSMGGDWWHSVAYSQYHDSIVAISGYLLAVACFSDYEAINRSPWAVYQLSDEFEKVFDTIGCVGRDIILSGGCSVVRYSGNYMFECITEFEWVVRPSMMPDIVEKYTPSEAEGYTTIYIMDDTDEVNEQVIDDGDESDGIVLLRRITE